MAVRTPLLCEGLDTQNLKAFFNLGIQKTPFQGQLLFWDLWVCVLVLFLSILNRNEMFPDLYVRSLELSGTNGLEGQCLEFALDLPHNAQHTGTQRRGSFLEASLCFS